MTKFEKPMITVVTFKTPEVVTTSVTIGSRYDDPITGGSYIGNQTDSVQGDDPFGYSL